MQQRYTCPGCREVVAYGARFCMNCGIPLNWTLQQMQQQASSCPRCRTYIAYGIPVCPNCGQQFTWPSHPPPRRAPPYIEAYSQPAPVGKIAGERKSEGVAVLLAVLPMFFATLCGIGHMYVGRIAKGLAILFSFWTLFGIFLICLLMAAGIALDFEGAEVSLGLLLVGLLFGFGAIALGIWQIFDARAVCRRHNQQIVSSQS